MIEQTVLHSSQMIFPSCGMLLRSVKFCVFLNERGFLDSHMHYTIFGFSLCNWNHCILVLLKPRTARRARELWLCSPLLISSSSLSSTGDHLPLPEGAHLSRAPIPTNQDILGETRASPVVALLVFHPNHLQGRQDQDGWTTTTAPRNHPGQGLEQAGRRGRELDERMQVQCVQRWAGRRW